MNSATKSTINKEIDKLRFRTFRKVYRIVKKRHPNIKDSELRKIISERLHNRRPSKQIQRVYQVKIFSKFRNSWFTDIYDNTANANPRYWQLFINTNTRYVVAYPLQNKTAGAIKNNLEKFIKKFKPRKLTSDEESGLIAKENLELLNNNKCGLYIVSEQQHSTLGIIDRFIRTLRDMNTPQEKPLKSQSTDTEYTFISQDKMKDLLASYNTTVHSSTGYSPKEMMEKPELEDQYISKCLEHEYKQRGIRDFKLKKGMLVRYLIPRRVFGKRRYNVSRECYTIDDIAGNIYTLIAKDGTTKDLPRWRLIRVKPNENKRLGNTLGTDKGIVEEVVNEVGQNKLNVRFKMPDGSLYERVINKSELRMPLPQFESRYEVLFKTK